VSKNDRDFLDYTMTANTGLVIGILAQEMKWIVFGLVLVLIGTIGRYFCRKLETPRD